MVGGYLPPQALVEELAQQQQQPAGPPLAQQ
jgi:hypothetical protein